MQFTVALLIQALVVFLVIEGAKNLPAFDRFYESAWAAIVTNVVLNFMAAFTAFGGRAYLKANAWTIIAATILGTFATAGLHRAYTRFRWQR